MMKDQSIILGRSSATIEPVTMAEILQNPRHPDNYTARLEYTLLSIYEELDRVRGELYKRTGQMV